jgi:hypothetical protein
MSSISNIRNLTSIAAHTLHKGSPIERIVLGAALLGVGFIIAQKLYRLALSLFSTHQRADSLPKRNVPKASQAALAKYEQDLEKDLQTRFSATAPVSNPNAAVAQTGAVELHAHSLLAKLTINDVDETNPHLAEALYLYDELRKKINGEEDRFVFITKKFLESKGLPEILIWEVRENERVELKIPPYFNALFVSAETKLNQAGLSLKFVTRAEKFFARAEFRSGEPKEIFTLSELYQIVKLQGPHMLSPLEILQKKKKIDVAKQDLYASRLKIIEKTLSTVRTLLIDDMVKNSPEKHQGLYALFGTTEALSFVLENVCWLALDRALGSIEVTFVPSKETQQKIRKIDLEGNVVNIFADKDKKEKAQGFLLKILTDPYDSDSIDSLVKLLLSVGSSPERDSFIKKVQQPSMEVEERFIHQELGGLEKVQQFYNALTIATVIADEAKVALKTASDHADNQELITSRILSAAPENMSSSIIMSPHTYGKVVEEVSMKVVEASEKAVLKISGQRWQTYLTSLDQEVGKINSLLSTTLEGIVSNGWVKFENKLELIHLTGPQRWLLTKKMILQKIIANSLQEKGGQLVQEVGKGAVSFIKTLYGRLVTVLLAFDKRTKGAGEIYQKPADRVAGILFDSLLQSYRALLQVKKEANYTEEVGAREEAVVKELEKLGEIHASATNKGMADAVFLATLILRLLSILQPEGLSADIQKAIMSAVGQGRSKEPKAIHNIHKAIEVYNKLIEPWVKPIGNFLFQALENIIERQSASNVAKQMSEVLNPININSLLVDLLKDDQSDIVFEKPTTGNKNNLKWYEEDQVHVETLLEERKMKSIEIKALEKQSKAIEKVKGDNEELLKILRKEKLNLAELDMKILPELLKRIVLANVPSSLAGYVLPFSYDLHELIQYPRILRHVVFNVMEKAVYILQPLDKAETEVLLSETADADAKKPFIDFIFSSQLKIHIGNTLAELFWNMSPADNTWTVWGWIGQTTAKRLPVGQIIFTKIQTAVESLVITKFQDDKASISWSGAKLIGWLNRKILTLAADETKKGMTAKITALLDQALLKDKEEEKTVAIPQAALSNFSGTLASEETQKSPLELPLCPIEPVSENSLGKVNKASEAVKN